MAASTAEFAIMHFNSAGCDDEDADGAAGSAAGSDHRSLLSREPVESFATVDRFDGAPLHSPAN